MLVSAMRKAFLLLALPFGFGAHSAVERVVRIYPEVYRRLEISVRRFLRRPNDLLSFRNDEDLRLSLERDDLDELHHRLIQGLFPD